ncbi:MAG: hypothetical protein J6C66_06075 [Prevotella sp.]|nr:hypothetical protein [Prevotella sp.]
MKQQNVYMKGYVGRGKEVIAFFTALGGVNKLRFTGEENGLLYLDDEKVIKLVTIYSDIERYEEIVRTYKRVFLPTIDEGYVIVLPEDIYPTAELASFHLQHNARYKHGEFIVKKLETTKKR